MSVFSKKGGLGQGLARCDLTWTYVVEVQKCTAYGGNDRLLS